MQYLRARYYNPGTAAFVTEDSYLGELADPLTLNRYNYVKSSPLNYIDPSGFVYILAWSYGSGDVEAFEKYANRNLELSYKLDKNKDTSDWKKEVYDEFDQRSAFARAARTKYEELIEQGVSEQEIVFTRVDKADDFAKKWKEWSEYEEVDELHLFSHGYRSGPEVYKGFVETPSGIIRSVDVPLSEKLNFAENAASVFYGCNTGGGDFAQAYADYQNVTTYAQSDYSSFSHDKVWRTHFVDTISDFEKGDKVYQGVYKYGLYFDTINISTDFGTISSTYMSGYRKNIERLGVKFEPQN